MIQIILFLVGFVLIVKGADYLVDGSSFIAQRFSVSDMAIGLTIVAFGTSLPELVVNVTASIKNIPELAIGNIFGSNISNTLLILGMTALICPLPLRKKTIVSEIPFVLIATLLVGFLANAGLFMDGNVMVLCRLDGIILLFFFGLYLVYIGKTAKENKEEIFKKDIKELSSKKSVLLIVAGVIALYLGGTWVISGAVFIAESFNLSQGLVGLTLVALGTSLPELVTSITAARKGNIDISIGNIIGSNIFNLLWVLPLSALINPLPFSGINNTDIIIMVFASTLVILSMATGVKNAIDRKDGLIFLMIYAAYIVYIFYRG
jgi:cation:H+ antiporter